MRAAAAVVVKGDRKQQPWMNNVRIAASRIGKVAVGFAGPNDGVGYGFAALHYQNLVYENADGKVDVPSPRLASPGIVNIDQELIFQIV